MKQSELFPEALLVESEGGMVYTTSLKVAEHFHKRHDKVLEVIRRVIKQSDKAEWLPNFRERLDKYMAGGKRLATPARAGQRSAS